MNKLLIVSIFIINLINIIMIYSISINSRMRNAGLRIIVFKEKRLGKIVNGIKNDFKFLSQVYYNKLLVCTAEGINTYNELSEEEKILIETVLSLCY
jgi:hypothetical protein